MLKTSGGYVDSKGDTVEQVLEHEMKSSAPWSQKDQQLCRKVLDLVQDMLHQLEAGPYSIDKKEQVVDHDNIKYPVVCSLDKVRCSHDTRAEMMLQDALYICKQAHMPHRCSSTSSYHALISYACRSPTSRVSSLSEWSELSARAGQVVVRGQTTSRLAGLA
jgi:hypothetical protein